MPRVPTSDGLVQPAGPNDAAWIPNGIFRGENLDINIHTVMQGQLAGKRIIKRKIGLAYKGYAFLMTDGTQKVWQRFREHSQHAYVRAAERFLAEFSPAGAINMVPELVPNGESYWAIYSCRVCNTDLYPVRDGAVDRLYRGMATAHQRCSEICSVDDTNFRSSLNFRGSDSYIPPVRTPRRRISAHEPVRNFDLNNTPTPFRAPSPERDELGHDEIL